MSDRRLEAGYLVADLAKLITRGEGNLRTLPDVLVRVYRDRLFMDRIDPNTKEPYRFERFEDFVLAEPPGGLGSDQRQLEGLCRDSPEARAVLEEAFQRPEGQAGHSTVYNIHSRPAGTSQASALRKLRRNRPDLHARVVAGELSANAAAVEAGWRQRKAQVRLDDPEAAVKVLLKHYSAEDLRRALDDLGS